MTQDKFLKELFDLCDRYKLQGVRCLSQGQPVGVSDGKTLVEVWVPQCPLPKPTALPQ